MIWSHTEKSLITLEKDNPFWADRHLWKIEQYKVYKQKFIAFLCYKNEQTEKEIRKTIPFTIAFKKIKYLRTHLTKEPYNVNYKSLKK
jgi:hypothetical protein